MRGGFQRVALGGIVGQALAPFRINGRIEIAEGPLVDFEPVVSQSLTLMLHELATNALKYGALSTGAGMVSVGWRIEANGGNPHLSLTWTESGGPPVSAPGRVGQGTRFIKGSARHELRGEATLDFLPEGLLATIAFPLKDAVNTTSAIRPSEES